VPKISVIIPMHANETAHHGLVQFFETYDDLEIILSEGFNRAQAMNKGAQQAKCDYLWFVHADTKLSEINIKKLVRALDLYPQQIHYFDLKFSQDAPCLTYLNGWGANIRSQFLGLPWGDQAFCVSREVFLLLGEYDETLQYGEDHMLIWKAHHKSIKLNRINESIETSARQYKKKGWLALTVTRQYLWVKQALPPFFKLIKIKVRL
jgi:hypothetical protein